MRNLPYLKRMKPIGHNYTVYIIANDIKSVIYIGVTNQIERRIYEHLQNKGNKSTFAGRYSCYNLVYYELHSNIEHAIEREKEIKKWRREKKDQLITDFNRNWDFLNNKFLTLD